jgi:hypothetical protein
MRLTPISHDPQRPLCSVARRLALHNGRWALLSGRIVATGMSQRYITDANSDLPRPLRPLHCYLSAHDAFDGSSVSVQQLQIRTCDSCYHNSPDNGGNHVKSVGRNDYHSNIDGKRDRGGDAARIP